MSRVTVLLTLTALAVLPQCRERTDTWHCDNPARAACSQWTSPVRDPAVEADQKAQCRAMGGAVGDGPCSEELVIGSCVARATAETRIVYYPPRSRSDAERACAALGGRWY